MSEFPDMGGTAQFAPEPNDSILELRWKAESMLEYLRDHESFLRQFPTCAFDERLALWTSYSELLAAADVDPELAEDALLDAHRVWGEEVHHAAIFVITMCAFARSDAARRRFADDPEVLDELIEKLEQNRPSALHVLSADDVTELREKGLLGWE